VRDGVTGQHFFEAPFAEHAYPEGVDGPGALTLLDVGAGVLLQHDAVDAVAQQEVAESQTGDASPDDDDDACLSHVCASLRAQSEPITPVAANDGAARVVRRTVSTLGFRLIRGPPVIGQQRLESRQPFGRAGYGYVLSLRRSA
jgi:hypothetical protein